MVGNDLRTGWLNCLLIGCIVLFTSADASAQVSTILDNVAYTGPSGTRVTWGVPLSITETLTLTPQNGATLKSYSFSWKLTDDAGTTIASASGSGTAGSTGCTSTGNFTLPHNGVYKVEWNVTIRYTDNAGNDKEVDDWGDNYFQATIAGGT